MDATGFVVVAFASDAKKAKPVLSAHLVSALRTLETESGGLAALATAMADGLGAPFAAAVETIRAARGRVIVTGMGKSGHVARKIAATLASTGTPAFFVHAADASHGDLQPLVSLAELSLAPEQAKWAGISWPQLMTWMVDNARRPQ